MAYIPTDNTRTRSINLINSIRIKKYQNTCEKVKSGKILQGHSMSTVLASQPTTSDFAQI